MRRMTTATLFTAAAILCGGAMALGQVGARGLVQGKLGSAIQEHNQAVNEAIGEGEQSAPPANQDSGRPGSNQIKT